MKKSHTKSKRKFGLSTNKRQYAFFHPQAKPHRQRTFVTEAMAKEWAAKTGMKEGEFTIKSAKRGKRFQLVPTKKA